VPRLTFSVSGAAPLLDAVSPAVALALGVRCEPAVTVVNAVLLRCDVRIDAAARAYAPDERDGLFDLFGEPARWGRTLRALLWTRATVFVPAFEGAVTVELPLPCTMDVEAATAKYFGALSGGEIPLSLLFSGTVFHAVGGALQAAPLPWATEARFRLPLDVYRAAIAPSHGGGGLLALPRDVLDRLRRYKSARGVATWAEAIDGLLAEHEAAR
jgi:hypothetical protein